MDHYTLSYVNTQSHEVVLDREFATIIALMAFVNENYHDYTSYQIIVCRKTS